MYLNNEEAIKGAIEIYKGMHKEIRKMFDESKEYGKLVEFTEEETLYNAEYYLQQMLKNLASAEGGISGAELDLINSIYLLEPKEGLGNPNAVIESKTHWIPKYLAMAKKLDEATGSTRYAIKLLRDTEEIFRIIEGLDGYTSSEEIDFRNKLMENMKAYLEEKGE